MFKLFNNINEVIDYLCNQRKKNKRENLNRIANCYKLLGIKSNYKIIHIAGTNGKGSISEGIKTILSNCNLHVGIFTSPYVISFNERIRINDRMISNSEIMHYMNILKKFNDEYTLKYDDNIPFFELTLLMALMYFEDRKIDVLVLECGLGGRLDATNFLKTDLAVISNIGFDHMLQLGNTLEEIAYHKLGIVKNDEPLITAVDESLLGYFKDNLRDTKSNIIWVNDKIKDVHFDLKNTYFNYKGLDYKTNLIGLYQAYNMSIAIEASNYIINNINKDIIDYSLNNIFWPGRFEIINDNIILDGAHNIHAIKALCNTLKNLNKKINIVYTSLKDKDYKAVINELDNIANKYYFTTIDDLRKEDPNIFKSLTNIESTVIENPFECVDYVINNTNKEELVLITGSLHFISIIREYLKNK